MASELMETEVDTTAAKAAIRSFQAQMAATEARLKDLAAAREVYASYESGAVQSDQSRIELARIVLVGNFMLRKSTVIV